MKKKFSKHWKSSKLPRKQRKFLAKAPLHIKRKMICSGLSKELKIKYKKRSIPLRKGDKIIIIRGKFKKKEGKISEINTKKTKVYVEGIQIKKQDGSKVSVPFKASNLKIIELNLEDKKRIRKLQRNKEKIKEDEK
jgi:large subunit ribosomal protein L24